MTGESDTHERTSMASTKADLRELKSNSSATVQELQEFLGQLRGKSPQEMLGIVTSSQLVRATGLSIVIVTSLILLFTAIPYFFGDNKTVELEGTVSQPAPTQPAATQPAAQPTEQPPATPTDPSNKPVELAPLGVNEELPAPPNVNPLEDKKDDFLKDLE